jgi:hypothetical protein
VSVRPSVMHEGDVVTFLKGVLGGVAVLSVAAHCDPLARMGYAVCLAIPRDMLLRLAE